ncbi:MULTISPECIES: PACE efflux transporter [unclassified Chelatococcus]|uniref:PACE efflux transporter n=1 Tax=unclassified Chelatococcus TaxID=2638111 RepID=UPI001BCB8027|nr:MULTISPECIES: PACE efflux transporter [unclassified Chelatococcus]MBS7699016.1 PACE efflux transporter [Chelatococcus sp. YT9]MBX3558949.1 PACE efflux transporter [Chelatococcus sp.]
MSLRTFPDRMRHAILFEVIGLAVFTPTAALLFNQPVAHMGVIGVVSATIATTWNFLFNLAFDHALVRLRGHSRKTVMIRVTHAILFEGGLVIMLIPMIAWYLGISLWAALMMDIAIVAFYLVYAFVFNIVYDRVFPVPDPKEFALSPAE